MSENTGGVPRDDDPSVPPPPPAFGQPAGAAPQPPYGAPQPPSGAPQPPYGTPQPPYGAPQPPYGQAPHGQQYGPQYGPPPRSPGVDVAGAFSWAFTKFGQTWVAFVVGSLLWIVGIVVLTSIVQTVFSGVGSLGADGSTGGAFFALATMGVGGLLSYAVMVLLGAVYVGVLVRTALRVADGRAVSLGDMFDLGNVGPVVVLGLLLMVAQTVLSAVWIIGWIVSLGVVYFTFFAFHAVVDRGVGAVDGLRASVTLQTKDVGSSILVLLVALACAAVGVVLCGVGVLVGAPVAALFSAYAYRQLTGGTIAP